MEERTPLTLASAGLNFLFLIVTFFVLTFDVEKERLSHQDAKNPEPPEHEDRMIDVQMPDGRVTKTEAAASRWENLTIDWVEKTPEQKIATVIKIIFGVLAIVISIIVLFQNKFFDNDSIFAYILSGHWEHGLNIFAFTVCFIIISIGMTVATIIRKILNLLSTSTTFGTRGETFCRLLGSFIKYVSILIVAIVCFCLSVLGVNTTTLLASAGILSLAISFGAKELVADITSRLFIIFEGDFRVGDIIMVGD